MQKIQDIPIKVEPADGSQINHANAMPILHEILYALNRFSTDREPWCIDLRAIPFGPGDEDELLSQLGQGEISLTMDSLGKSRIWETAFSGVWVVDHRNAEGERVALQIEVCRIPEIVLSQQEDIFDAIGQLERHLDTD